MTEHTSPEPSPQEQQPSSAAQQSAPPQHPFATATSHDRAQESRGQKRTIWLAAAIIIVLFTGAMGWYVFNGTRAGSESGGSASGSTSSEQSGEHDGHDHGADEGGDAAVGEGSPTAWPRNMATGGVVFSGAPTGSGEGLGVVESAAQPAGSALPQEPTADVDRIVVYLDYRCPYCANFEQANSELLQRLAATGEVEVEIRTLTFLDRVSAGSEYSSRAAGALACIADAQPEGAWEAHNALLAADFQPQEGVPGHDDDAIIAHLDARIDGGLSAAASSCIEERAFVPFAQFRDAWTSGHTVPDAKAEGVSVTGTPFALVNGEVYAGDPTDGAAFEAFVQQQGVGTSSSE